MKQSCRRVIEHSGESELVESIKSNKPKRTKTDAWIVNVGPRGYSKKKTYRSGKGKARKYRVSNALKLIWKEYGVAGTTVSDQCMQCGSGSRYGKDAEGL